MTSEKLIQITRKRLMQFIVGLVLFLLCLFSVFAFLMHRMCGEMIATALHNQMAPPSYAAASTLPPVITFIGENKKIIVEPPVIEPTPPPFKPTYRVHYDNDEEVAQPDDDDYWSNGDYSGDYSDYCCSSMYEGSPEYDVLTDDENLDEKN